MNRDQSIFRRTLPAIGLLVLTSSVLVAVLWQETSSASAQAETPLDDSVASAPNGFQLFGEAAKLFAQDGVQHQQFGSTVAISGNTLVVGAPGDVIGGVINKGSVYVYVRDGSQWILQQKLIAPDVGQHDHFGDKVAIEGDTILVGVPHDGFGSAYIFTRSGSAWTQHQKLTASDASNGRQFGQSVAISGNTLVVTDRNLTTANTLPGTAYIFEKVGPTWVEQQKIVPAEAVDDDYFASAAISGTNLLLGSPSRQIGSFDQGAVYYYAKSGSLWTRRQRLFASDGYSFDRFGGGISISGETAIIGAGQNDACPLQDSGAAYVFVKSGSEWIQQQKLAAPDAQYGALFGSSVGISGDTAVVGTPFHWNGYNQWQGAGYVFRRSGNSWSFVQKLLASDGDRSDRLGFSAAIESDTAVFGAYLDKVGGNDDQGSVYVFSEGLAVLPSPTITPTPTPTPIPSPSATPTPMEPVWKFFNTRPPGLSYSVDSTTFSTPQMLGWMRNSIHTIGTTSPQNGPPGTRYVFVRWNDCGPIVHTVNADEWGADYNPVFVTQFKLTTEVTPQETGAIMAAPAAGDGYYDWEKDVTLTAVPSPGYRFVGWTGSGSGSYTGSENPALVTVNSPITQTALFAPIETLPDLVAVKTNDLAPGEGWTRQFGSTAFDDTWAIGSDAASNVYVAGSTAGSLPGQTTAGPFDAFVQKYDESGFLLWTRQFGSSTGDNAYGIAVDADGTSYTTGVTVGTLPGQVSFGSNDVFARKYDPDGNIVWTRQFGTSGVDQVGGAAIDGAGNVYFAGSTDGTLPGQTNSGGQDAALWKYDADGNLIWQRQFGTNVADLAYSVSVDGDNVYVAGATDGALPGQTPSGNTDAIVRKYDAAGNLIWTRQFGTFNSDSALDVDTDPAGNVYLSGQTQGALPGQTHFGGQDGFVRKYSRAGDVIWTRQFGTVTSDAAWTLALDLAGNAYAAGWTVGSLPGQTSSGGSDAALWKVDRDGNLIGSRQFGTSQLDDVRDVTVAANGKTYLAGNATGNLPGQTALGQQDVFVRSYSGGTSSCTPWTWTITFVNQGTGSATFSSGQSIGRDDLPNSNISYSLPSIGNFTGITGAGNIAPLLIGNSLSVSATGGVTIAPGGSFTVTIPATPAASGAFNNPRAGGAAAVDPNNVVAESSEANNSFSDVVTITGCPTPSPSPTPTPTLTPSPIPEYDLTVEQSENPDPVLVGGNLYYSITVTIHPTALGGSASPIVRFGFPTGVPFTFVQAGGTHLYNAVPDASGVTFSGGVISTGGTSPGSATLSVVIRPNATGTLTSTGSNVIVDPANLYYESNESNNTAQTIQTSVRRAPFDHDGDGRTDYSVFRPSNGAWYLWRSLSGFQGMQFGVNSDKLTPADYDGDGKADIAVYRPSTGTWYIVRSSNGTIDYPVFGVAEDLPAPGDYDGDGKADLTVFRPSQGIWYRVNSSNGSFVAFLFGANGDVPTVGDFDGDGKNDIGIWRPSNGDWYHIRSSNGSVFGERFGQTGDKIAPADYDGDGKTDIAIFRPSTGLWVVWNSATSTYSYLVFGSVNDVPVAGDYDGDGRADIAVWRPADGTWYVQRSSNGSFIVFPWGQNGDVPTPNAYGN